MGYNVRPLTRRLEVLIRPVPRQAIGAPMRTPGRAAVSSDSHHQGVIVSKTKKLLASVLLVGVTASLAAFGVFSAFSSQTSNPGNSFSAGTVNISDNDGDTAAYTVSGGKPGSTQ